MPRMYIALLILHFLGLAVGLGAGFAQLTLGLIGGAMPGSERNLFLLRALILSKNVAYGLVLLILSGLGMTAMRGFHATMQWGGGAFHAKLGFVVLTLIVFGYSQVVLRRTRQTGGGYGLIQLRKITQLMLLLGVATVICAVIAFK
jgi:uncharacterized membrane protein